MKIGELCLKNNFINYENISLSFETYGIYLITGPNGTGKTSILERVVFGDCKTKFDNDITQAFYKDKRYLLFSYVSQEIIDSDETVLEYIKKANPSVSKKDIEEYLFKFKMFDVSLNQIFNSLSGGEKIKASIISAILKNTPYIFLDEPTNYLDDESVILLKTELIELSKERVIVVSTHDPRILDVTSKVISIDGKECVSNYLESEKALTHNTIKDYKISLFNIAFKKGNKLHTFIMYLLTILILICLSIFIHIQYNNNYFSTELPSRGTILAYSVEHYYGESNQLYCKNEKIDIKETSYADMIYYNNIEEIYNVNGVEDIYIVDTIKRYKYSSYLENINSEESKLEYFSIPDFLKDNDIMLSWMGSNYWRHLIYGRLPADEKKEVALSKLFLKRFFNKENINEEIIGEKIIINESEYTISGILEYDYCVVSYSNLVEDGGVYHYSKDTYEDFKTEQESFLNYYNFLYKNIETIAIRTDEYKEREVLNYLIENYPANNFFSYQYAIRRDRENNKTFEKNIYLIVTPAATLLGVSLLLLQRQHIKLNAIRVKDYMRYYINKKIKYFYMLQCLCFNIIIVGIGFLTNIILGHFSGIFDFSFPLLSVTIALIVFPSFAYTIFYTIKNINFLKTKK